MTYMLAGEIFVFHVKAPAIIVKDNSGRRIETSILLIENNGIIAPLFPLVEYLVKMHVKSRSSRDKLIQAVGLLLDYIEANYDCFKNPKDLFSSFAQAVYTGTIGEGGEDESGLFWTNQDSKAIIGSFK